MVQSATVYELAVNGRPWQGPKTDPLNIKQNRSSA